MEFLIPQVRQPRSYHLFLLNLTVLGCLHFQLQILINCALSSMCAPAISEQSPSARADRSESKNTLLKDRLQEDQSQCNICKKRSRYWLWYWQFGNTNGDETGIAKHNKVRALSNNESNQVVMSSGISSMRQAEQEHCYVRAGDRRLLMSGVYNGDGGTTRSS